MKLKIIEQESVDQLKTAGKFIKENKTKIAVAGALGVSGVLTGCGMFEQKGTPTPNYQATAVWQNEQILQRLNTLGQAQIAQPTAEVQATTAPVRATRVNTRPATSAATKPAVAPTTAPATSVISCEHVTDETLSRKVVFEGLPVKAVNVLTTAVDKIFKTADWNTNAALNIGFAEPGGLSNETKYRKIDNTPYFIQTELQGWTKVFFQEGTLEWRGADGKTRRVVLPEKQGRTFGVYLRELYDVNGNKPVTVKVDCNVSDHGQTHHVDRPNTAFVSEGQLGQESLSVFTGMNYNPKTNQYDIPNDNTANDEFTVVVVDMNTGAYTVATQKGKGMPFELEQQNWK